MTSLNLTGQSFSVSSERDESIKLYHSCFSDLLPLADFVANALSVGR